MPPICRFLQPYFPRAAILNRSFYLPSFWQIADTEQSISQSGAKLIKILIEDRRTPSPPKTLKYVISAATPLPRENAQRFYDRFKISASRIWHVEAVNLVLAPTDLTDEDYAHL